MAKIYLIAGHGAGDPGACKGGYTEAALVRKLANRMEALGGNDVVLLDPSKNWYATGGISELKLPKGAILVELHLDSAIALARGGHVVIKSGFGADKYDKAIAAFLKEYFPGRSNVIVGRSDLANVNRAAAAGINYRLVEVCFISNKKDRTKLVDNMDEVAKGLLKACGVTVKTAKPKAATTTAKPKTTAATTAKKKTVAQVAKEVIQGKWGNGETRKKKLKAAGYDYNAVQKKVNELLK